VQFKVFSELHNSLFIYLLQHSIRTGIELIIKKVSNYKMLPSDRRYIVYSKAKQKLQRGHSRELLYLIFVWQYWQSNSCV